MFKRDIYTIEVNDNGDTIEFDLLDIELPYKLERAYKRVNEVAKDLKGKLIIIEKKANKKANKNGKKGQGNQPHNVQKQKTESKGAATQKQAAGKAPVKATPKKKKLRLRGAFVCFAVISRNTC